MNIRSVLCVGLALGAASLFAEVESYNVFGQIKCTTTFRKTMVAIPWVSTNATAQTIKVAEIIQTTNLDEGTMALHWNGLTSTWDAWRINASKEWETVATASETGVTVSENPTDAPIPRGTGIWLIRSDIDTNTGDEKTFYLYGKYWEGESGTLTCPANKSTIVCAPYAEANGYNLNSIDATAWAAFGTATGDAIRRQTDSFPYYEEWKFVEGTGWGRSEKDGGVKKFVKKDVVMPAGEAFWYVNRHDAAVNIVWPKL